MTETTITPWQKRAEELASREGAYADFAAWREWFETKTVDNYGHVLDELCQHTKMHDVMLYSLFWQAIDFSTSIPRTQ